MDNDYILLNTDKWRPPLNGNMYKCYNDNNIKVNPYMPSGTPAFLKDFDKIKKILPPDNINIDYINDKLNNIFTNH